jgi:hypothetical protein
LRFGALDYPAIPAKLLPAFEAPAGNARLRPPVCDKAFRQLG